MGKALNTWEGIIERLDELTHCASEETRIDLLVELLVHLRLIGQDPCITDQRTKKSDIETLHAELAAKTRTMLESVSAPSDRFIYYAREVIKKLPVRQGAEEMIERIRAEAEAFEENRTEDDPLRGFAGDLRKEVHRRLSPRIIKAFIEPYLELAQEGNPRPLMEAGYVALPSRFVAEEEPSEFIDLAADLLARLNFLWNYESGDLAGVKKQLAGNLELFERCFLRAEVEGFLDLLTPENLDKPHKILDLLKRLASFKHFLKESYFESRIALYDLLILDLSIGRLIFLLANDLTNNHYSAITPRNIRESMTVIHELLNISNIKGLAIHDVVRLQSELEELIRSSSYDFIKAKRCLGAICAELQRFLLSDIIDAMSGSLNRALETYGAPTSKLSQIKTRFFNNFIRRTQIHVLSEFTEKVAAAVDRELERQQDDRQLWSEFSRRDGADETERFAPERLVASTWGSLDEKTRRFLGGKGNSIIDMAGLGLPVPPAFILGYPIFALGDQHLKELVFRHVDELERITGRTLGDPGHPLIVSVRSGAPTSMPGVMATILNAGMTPEVRAALAERRGLPLTESVYRRFLQNCIAALSLQPDFEQRSDQGRFAAYETRSIDQLESILTSSLGPDFLRDPRSQLLDCIRLVYESRGSSAVRAYSETMATDARAETAVTVQRLVFGNLNERSLSGVLITRNPITGADELFGEFKRQAQGEEVVMGSANTQPVSALDPDILAELERGKQLLVSHYRQDLDIEFTVEDGRLYFLQARSARLGAFAHLAADTDFLDRGILSFDQYKTRLGRLESAHASVALPRADFGARFWNPPLTVGVPINSGVVSGTLVLSHERLREAEKRRESVVFFAHTTKPTDFAIMNGAHAIVTVYPGRTSHAAITAMAMNKPCIVGCADAQIDYEKRLVIFCHAGRTVLHEGERVTVDGNTGAVYRGVAPISEIFLSLGSVNAAVAQAGEPGEAVARVRSLIDSKRAFVDRETNLRRKSLDGSEDLAGLRILVRVDANIELGGANPEQSAAGARRVAQVVPTLDYLLSRGATPIVCSHLGDPGVAMDTALPREKIYEEFSLAPFARMLAPLLKGRLVFHDTSIGSSGLLLTREAMVPGSVNLIENLRLATGEKDNDDTFARSLAELSDGWFVNDAFNVCLRRHASITGVPKFVRHRLAGPLVAKELSMLELLLGNPSRPFEAVFCGSEVEAQFGVMAAMLPRVDRLVILLPAHLDSRDSVEAMIANFRGAYPDRVLVLERGEEKYGEEKALALRGKSPGTMLWSGFAGLAGGAAVQPDPLGILRQAMAQAALAVICSEEEKQFADLGGPRLHVSKGPRAFLEYLERLSLPGITALDPSGE